MKNGKNMFPPSTLIRKYYSFSLVLFFLCCAARPALAEELTLTTYYPAPYGGYAKLLTTGSTFLARDAGNVAIGKTGETNDKLLVNGIIRATENIFVKGLPVITKIECAPPLTCSVIGNTLQITIVVYKCPTISNNTADKVLCPAANAPTVATCQGQQQFTKTCYWWHRWYKLKGGCHQTQNYENCSPPM